MSTVVLIKLDSPEAVNYPPFGLLYVGGALKKAGYDVELLHITAQQVQEYVQKVVDKRPLFVGFSVFTGQAMRAHAEMCRQIKRLSDIPIVWGSVHPSLLPEQCLQESYIDIVVIGEGEITTVELAQTIMEKADLSQVQGIGYKSNGMPRINSPRPFIHDLDSFSLDWSLINIGRYIQPCWDRNRVLHFITSRGCPHRCTFCYNLKFNQRRWRAHSVDFVVSHINHLKTEHNLDGIIYWDDNFFVAKKRAFEILQRINLPYYAEARVEYIDKDFALQLNETGCRELLVGLESGSDRILRIIQKDSTVDDIYRAVEALSKYPNICLAGSSIMAYPTETREELKATLQMIARVFDIHRNTDFTTGFYLPHPGCELHDLAVKEGFSPPNRTEDWELLDRWAAKLTITWNSKITSRETKVIREHLKAMGLLFRYKVPFWKEFTRWRLLKGWYGVFNLDLRFINWISHTFNRYNKKQSVRLAQELLTKAMRAIFGTRECRIHRVTGTKSASEALGLKDEG